MINVQIIETEMLFSSYAPSTVDKVKVHFLIIPDNNSPIAYNIKCNGADLPQKRLVRGYLVPLILSNDIPIKQIDDHYSGCSNLNVSINKDFVEKYCNRLENSYHKIYREPNLTIHIDTSRINELVEGFTPVLVSGRTVTGLQFNELTKAIITSGNCV